ncbi:MAG: phytanoyl-CoA dioxygenase family protein [Acidimicrobiales bacterium]
MGAVAEEELASWRERGFFRVDGFAAPSEGAAMLDCVLGLVRAAAAGADIAPALVMPEQQADMRDVDLPELGVSKVFRVAGIGPFRSFLERTDVYALVAELIGTDRVDCFSSQFIFKNPGAWGQPWHQDSYYFPFEPPRPIVGLWLAVTEATLENGCLHVLAGSNHEAVHEHVADRRPGANYGYVEIVDHDMGASEPVLMAAGDLLVFDSHLMHRSHDNTGAGARAAMVFHFAAAGTVDHTERLRGYAIHDWLPVGRIS